jgi:hypothetical protein
MKKKTKKKQKNWSVLYSVEFWDNLLRALPTLSLHNAAARALSDNSHQPTLHSAITAIQESLGSDSNALHVPTLTCARNAFLKRMKSIPQSTCL